MKPFFQKYLGFFISILVIFTSALQEIFLKENVIIALLIASILCVGVFWNHILTVWSPMKELKKAKQERWNELEKKISMFLHTWKEQYDCELSFNIMRSKQGFFYRMRPKTILFFPKKLKVVWEYGSNRVNSKLNLTTEQGAAGRAYNDETTKIYDVEKMIRTKKIYRKSLI